MTSQKRSVLQRALVLLVLGAGAAGAQTGGQTTCSASTQGTNVIRVGGHTDEISDYSFICSDTSGAPANASVQAFISPSVPITSFVLSAATGVTEAAIVVSDPSRRSATRTTLGTVSGSALSFPNVPIPVSANVISPTPLTVNAPAFPSGVATVDYPAQQVAASGGIAPYTFAVTSGSLPDGLALSPGGAITGTPKTAGTSSFTVTATDANTATGMASLQITVRPFTADLLLSAGSLAFTVIAGNPFTPPSQNVQVQSTTIGTVLPYSVTVTGLVPWLGVTPAGGSTPGAFTVSLTAGASVLTASGSPYTGRITVTCGGSCAGTAQTVVVSLTVTAPPPQLSVSGGVPAFVVLPADRLAYAPVKPQTLLIQNIGGGTLGISSVTSGASWLSVTGTPGSLAAGPPVPLTLTVDPTGLPAGFYRTTLTIVSSGGTSVTPVTIFIATNPTMALQPAGVQFQISAGGAPGNDGNSFLVNVSSATPVNWAAAVLPGASWLSVTAANGTSTSNAPGTVTFAIDPAIAASLAPHAYYGRIEVTSAGVVNSPQDFEVVLNVVGATSPQTPSPSPEGLLFLTTVGTPVPPQTVFLFSNSAGNQPYQAAVVTNGGSWLSVTPTIGMAKPAGSTPQVSVNIAGLAAGVYYGGVSYAFGSAGIRTVNVTLVVQPAAAAAARALGPFEAAAASSCSPTVLVPAQVGPVNNFSAPTAWPTPLAIQLVNDCGSPVPNAQIVATFSNGDPPLPLTLANAGTGLYFGTWTPRHSFAQVQVAAKATLTGFPSATVQLTGSVTPNAAPLLTPGSTLHIFNPLVGAGLSPGTIVQLYGAYLASRITSAPGIPLATALSGTSVIIGGIQAPLYFVSPGQINAQIPFELVAGRQYQVIVSANGALTTPDNIQLTPVSPGLAAFPGGAVIAQHGDGSLVTETAPGKPGEFLVIYTAGLGGTDNPVATGAGSPTSPLARPQTMPTLTIDGKPATIAFAGLTPGLVGLYQVNFQVPADAKNGDLALVLSQGGLVGNSTVLPVHN